MCGLLYQCTVSFIAGTAGLSEVITFSLGAGPSNHHLQRQLSRPARQPYTYRTTGLTVAASWTVSQQVYRDYIAVQLQLSTPRGMCSERPSTAVSCWVEGFQGCVDIP